MTMTAVSIFQMKYAPLLTHEGDCVWDAATWKIFTHNAIMDHIHN